MTGLEPFLKAFNYH